MLAPIDRTARLCTLLDDPRLLGVIGGALGEDFNYGSGDGNYYTGDTGWHPDDNWGQLFACKVAFYLDPVTRHTGCLRVLPGSHRPDHFIRKEKIDPNRSEELFGVAPSEFPGNIALETSPGDVVLFNHDLFHASFGGGKQRRMFTMNVTRHCLSEPDMERIRRYVGMHTAGRYKVYLGAGMYTPTMLDTADTGRRRHLQQCAEIHDELFPEYARHRQPVEENGQ
jgi:ectoine hydroxylase-related dioxygenase (phytanoyl-CoA dioxygenase family)